VLHCYAPWQAGIDPASWFYDGFSIRGGVRVSSHLSSEFEGAGQDCRTLSFELSRAQTWGAGGKQKPHRCGLWWTSGGRPDRPLMLSANEQRQKDSTYFGWGNAARPLMFWKILRKNSRTLEPNLSFSASGRDQWAI
jgi:hypothetical protein